MSKSIIFLASALCFLSVLGSVYSDDDRFFVEGVVYCDTCRTQFITKLSEFLEGTFFFHSVSQTPLLWIIFFLLTINKFLLIINYTI